MTPDSSSGRTQYVLLESITVFGSQTLRPAVVHGTSPAWQGAQ